MNACTMRSSTAAGANASRAVPARARKRSNNLLRQYAQMRKMFKQMGKASFARKLAGMKLPGM